MNKKSYDRTNTPALLSYDLGELTEEEREHIVKVVVKDFEIRAADRKRLNKFEEIIHNNVLGSDKTIEINNCTLCGREFSWFSNNKIFCKTCNRPVCQRCSTEAPGEEKIMMCTLCIRRNGFKAMTCEWFYEKFIHRFEDFGSSIIVKNVLGNKYDDFKVVSDFYLEPKKRSIILESDNNSFDLKTLDSVKKAQTRKFHSDHKEILMNLTDEHSRIKNKKGVSRKEKAQEYDKMLKTYKEDVTNLLETFTNVIYLSTEKHYIADNRDMDSLTNDVLHYVREQVEKIIKVPIDKDSLESLVNINDADDDGFSVLMDEKIVSPEGYLAQILVDELKVKLRI